MCVFNVCKNTYVPSQFDTCTVAYTLTHTSTPSRTPSHPHTHNHPLRNTDEQIVSLRKNVPRIGFGTSDRDDALKVFISAEHEKGCYGRESPGPCAYKPVGGPALQVWGWGGGGLFFFFLCICVRVFVCVCLCICVCMCMWLLCCLHAYYHQVL